MNHARTASADAVGNRQLDLLVAERLGDQRAPDVSATVLASLRNRRRRARRPLLQAAAGLLGIGVVVAIWFAAHTADLHELQRPPLGPAVHVDSIAAIERLPVHTDNVRLELHTADAVRALVRLRGLRRLDVSFDAPETFRPRQVQRPAFFPEAADALGMLTSLEELDISGHGPVSGLASLATLARLRKLRIHGAFVEPQSLAVLKRLPRLEDLVLEATLTLDEHAPWLDMRDPDYGLRSFAAAGRLRSLKLTACIVDADAIAALVGNPLQTLDLYGLHRRQRVRGEDNSLEAAVFSPIGRIETLRDLSLRVPVDATVLRGLRDLPHLASLDLGSAHGLRGEAVGAAIAALPHVRELSVGGSDVDTAALLALTGARSVEDLTLGGSKGCDDDVLAAVCRMPNLRRLTMPIVPGFTDAGMAPLADTRLEHLWLSWSRDTTAAGLMHLPTTLRSLHVEGHMLDERVLEHLADVTDWTIEFDSRMELPLVDALVDSPLGQHLERLVLAGDLSQLAALEPLADLPRLHTLDVHHCIGEVPDACRRSFEANGKRLVPPLQREAGDAQTVIDVLEVESPPGGGGR